MAKVFLGIGHGGSDPGAVANGLKEKDINLTIGLACRAELERHGVEVLMSRYKDEEDDLREEIRECNAFDPDLAGDLHNNAGRGDGAEVYYFSTGTEGKELAQNILDEIVAIGQNSRGIKTRVEDGVDYYGFIRETYCPAVIVEYAFLDHPDDYKTVDTVEEQRAMGVATAKGFLKKLGIAWKEPEKPKPVEPEKKDVLYRVQIGAYKIKANAEKRQAEAKAAGFTDTFIVTVEQ